MQRIRAARESGPFSLRFLPAVRLSAAVAAFAGPPDLLTRYAGRRSPLFLCVGRPNIQRENQEAVVSGPR
jgi:hypothetical protein